MVCVQECELVWRPVRDFCETEGSSEVPIAEPALRELLPVRDKALEGERESPPGSSGHIHSPANIAAAGLQGHRSVKYSLCF